MDRELIAEVSVKYLASSPTLSIEDFKRILFYAEKRGKTHIDMEFYIYANSVEEIDIYGCIEKDEDLGVEVKIKQDL